MADAEKPAETKAGDKAAEPQGIVEKGKAFLNKHVYQIEDDGRPASFYSKYLFTICSSQPLICLLAFFCQPCYAIYQRYYILGDGFGTDYRCCQGAYGKCWCPDLAKRIPWVCLILEGCFLTGCAVSGNRAAMAKKFKLKDRTLECCCVITNSILTLLGMIDKVVGIFCNACLMAQQYNEWEFRKTNPNDIIEV